MLGTLLEAGLPIVDAIGSLKEATVFYQYRRFYRKLETGISEGLTFKKMFSTTRGMGSMIPAAIQEMVVTAENSGSLPQTLSKIGLIFEEKTETSTKNLSVILEPVLLVIVWVGVVGVALAVILPIYSLVGGLTDAANSGIQDPTGAIEVDGGEFVDPVDEIGPLPVLETVEGIVDAIIPGGEEAVLNELAIAVPGGVLNVREESSPTSGVLTQVASGDVFEYTEERDGWYQIKLDDETLGWVFGDYVELVETNE